MKFLYVIGCSFALIITVSAQATDKIAVVNMAGIFQQLPQRVTIAKKLESEFKDRAIDLQKQESDLQNKIQYLHRAGATMKASERYRMEKEIMSQRETLTSKAQAFEQDSRRRQIEERGKLLSCIQDAVKKVATNDNYALVIDANAVAYVSQTKDITSEVLKQVK